MQTKYESEAAALIAARKLNDVVQIVESNGTFYLETDDDQSMIRYWERLVYSGEGRKARA